MSEYFKNNRFEVYLSNKLMPVYEFVPALQFEGVGKNGDFYE